MSNNRPSQLLKTNKSASKGKKSSLQKFISKFRSLPVEGWFLIFGGVFGGLFLVVTPPMGAPDEPVHFFRAYQVSELKVMSSQNPDGSYGGNIPVSVLKTAQDLLSTQIIHRHNAKYPLHLTRVLLRVPLAPHTQTPVNFTGSALYSPVCYFAPAILIAAGRLLHAPPIILIYLGRLGALGLWLLLVASAIRLTPVGKWAILALALIPVSLFQASMLSADGITNGLVLLLVALVLKYWLEKITLSYRQIALLSAVVIGLALSKPSYAILGALVLLIPTRRFGFGGWSMIAKLSVVGLGALFAAAWLHAVAPITHYAASSFPDKTVVVSDGQQLKVIEHDPVRYLTIVYNTVITTGSDALYQSLIGMMGAYDTPIPLWTCFIVCFTVGLTLLAEGAQVPDITPMLWLKKFFVLSLMILSIIIICTALYLTYTPVGWFLIYGIQGRYLMALSGLLVILCLWRRPIINIPAEQMRHLVLGSQLTALSVTLIVLVTRYYVVPVS